MIEETRSNFMNWISTLDFEEEHAFTFEKRYKNTGDWLIKEPVFKQWFNVTDSCVLWCYGKRNYLPNIISFVMSWPVLQLTGHL